MKKYLIALLLSLSCVCAVTAVGCSDNQESSSLESSSVSDSSSDSLPAEKTLSVQFEEGDGYTFNANVANGEKLAVGDTLTFTVDMSVFYTGYPVVYINDKAVAPNNDGVYNIEMTESVHISVSGIQKAVSNMLGSGSFEDAYVVTSPIDLLYIAEQVNKGVESYVKGAYILANDIDCGGEELEVIGDLSTESSFFSGCFSCETDSESGQMNRYTISNFTINTDDVNYVGLFGAVYADATVTSSGLFYGIRLDNFTINASISDKMTDSRSISVGSLIGYGVGANVYLCDAANGEINVYGDSSYFSFAGGLIGYQQAFYSADYDTYFASEIVYSSADVDVRILSGSGLCAGGISGYLATNVAMGATAFIHNSYATGNISGALRSGGIAGSLGQYTSVSNCYATGSVSATAKQSADFLTDLEYGNAYAGGLVGYAENDSIVNDSFFDGTLSASSLYGSAFKNVDIAGGDKAGTATAVGSKYVVQNCISSPDIADDTLFNKQLGWGTYDWVFKKNAYPAINYASPDSSISASLRAYFISSGEEVTVEEKNSYELEFFNTSMSSSNIYAPVGNYFMNSMEYYFTADNGYLSYGYFFDKACTKRVPYAYVPQKNIELYIGFADATPILGKYTLVYSGNTAPLSVEFFADGTAAYTDGSETQTTMYLYDGENVILESVRLTRYYNGEIIIDESDNTVLQDAAFDINRYNFCDFFGSFQDGVLSLYDGIYFTAEHPLVAEKSLLRGAYYTADGTTYTFYGKSATVQKGSSYQEYTNYTLVNGVITLGTTQVNLSDLRTFDTYKGTWTKSATTNKIYTFDGKGNWTYTQEEYVRDGYSYEINNVESANGTYTLQTDGTLLFQQKGKTYTASFNSDGFLEIKADGISQTYYAENSYVGTWQVNNVTLTLLGINQDGLGKATLSYGDGNLYELAYENSETDGYVALYWYESDVKSTVFGYFTYLPAYNTLYATLIDPNSTTTGYMQANFFVLDEYYGEWISNSETFLHTEFSFNGNGLYNFLYGYAGMEGTLTLTENGISTEITYTLESTQKGSFAYQGVLYTMTYDEDKKAVILTANGVDSNLERKDVLANTEFIDAQGNIYLFDGRSNLKTGGTFTVNEHTEYVYTVANNGWDVLLNGEKVGTLTETDTCYLLTVQGETTELYLTNSFMGEWAIGGNMALFQIGATDLNGIVNATFKGYPVKLTQVHNTLLTFSYRENGMPITYYVYVIYDAKLGYDVLVLSQYTDLFHDYLICTKANELFGTWTSENGFTLRFDGITSGSYSSGTAHLSMSTDSYTPYSYIVEEGGIMMWSQELLGNKTYYYKIELLNLKTDDLTGKNVFMQYDAEGNLVAALRRTEVDSLFLTDAVDENGVVYVFDGLGTVRTDNDTVYTYKILAYNDDNTVNLEITDENGVTYSAVLNYKDSQNITLTIGEEITE